MNAVIALCSFCEIHGPKTIFTTQTYRNYNLQNDGKLKFYGPKEVLRQGQSVNSDLQDCCKGCDSLGNLKYLSNDHETKVSFLSSRLSLLEDIRTLLKHACIRSLSCEVYPSKEGICYFGDENRGHTLSHTFFVKDAQARGLKRWCSFIVFMRDKQFLLNMWPFLIDNLKTLINELQSSAEAKYNADETECPQRVVRLANISNANIEANSSKQPRCFSTITDDKYIFVRVHMWLVWILSAGSRHLVEILPTSLLDEEINFNLENHLEIGEGISLVNAKTPVNLRVDIQIPEFQEFADKNPASILRKLRNKLGKEQFQKILYAALVGIQILVRGEPRETLEALYGLCSLVPKACQRVKIQAQEYLESNAYNFISVDTSVAVPVPCSEICRLDILPAEHVNEVSKSHVIKWTGELPIKLPILLIKLEKSFDNEMLIDSVMKVYFSTLQEEWTNIAKILHAMHGRGHRGNLTNLMQSLGAGPQDKKLLDAWSMGLPSNPA